MLRLKCLSRRGFGRGLGFALALPGLSPPLLAQEGPLEAGIRIERFSFDPPQIEVAVGDSVTWTNGDLAPHTATAIDGEWDTGALGMGDAARIIFRTPGRYPYHCVFHPNMTGMVIVHATAGG